MGHLTSRVVANSSGEIAFSGNLSGVGAASAAIWSGAPGALAIVAQRADTAPGTGGAKLNSFSAESIGEGGAVAFRGLLQTQTGLVTAADNEGIWTNRSGSLELIAREGSDAPCLPVSGPQFDRFTDLYVGNDGTVCFYAYLKGPGVSSANDGSFWRSAPGGTLHLVVREGDTANSTDGAIISNIASISCNGTGNVTYVASLASGAGDTVTANNHGIWLDDGTPAAAELVVRKNDTFMVDEAERTVTSIGFDYTTNALGGTGGYGRVINDSSDIMLKLSLDGNQSGLFILHP